MIINCAYCGLNINQPGENKRKIIYTMIERRRIQLQNVAVMMRFTYVIRTSVGANNIMRIFMFAEFMHPFFRRDIKRKRRKEKKGNKSSQMMHGSQR